jgi:hypothetical protein
MIIRLGTTLAKKIKEYDLPSLPADPSPFADWTARLFTADRTQYILITNSVSLYSVVVYGRGVTNDNAMIHKMTDMMRDVMEEDGFRLLYEKQVAPQTASVSFSKAVNRSVIGSMNQLILEAKWRLTEEEISPYDLSFGLNQTPLSYLRYLNPRKAFQLMVQEP